MMRVVKIGGRVQRDERLPSIVLDAWRVAPGELCLVHGGGDEISALQRALGVEPVFVAGRRVTSAADIDLVRMVLSGSANKRLVSRLISAGVPAVGLSGEDGTMLGARRIDAALGAVGAPTDVNVELLRLLLSAEYLPVISPLGRDLDASGALNINGDDAAAAIAAALESSELLLVADVPGVIGESGEIEQVLTPHDAAALVERGVALGGMAAKLSAARAAIAAGVSSVRVGTIEAIADRTLGTVIAPAARSLA
jgi:acetylglutamate kinase